MSVGDHGRRAATPRVTLVTWAPRFRSDVERLSREWIEKDFISKAIDEAYYADPEGEVVRHGGEIWIALDGESVVGTVAAKPDRDGAVELSKLSVTERAKRHGVGRALCEAMIGWARARGAPRVFLLTNSGLHAALALYRALGFVERPMPGVQPHEDADVYMELELA